MLILCWNKLFSSRSSNVPYSFHHNYIRYPLSTGLSQTHRVVQLVEHCSGNAEVRIWVLFWLFSHYRLSSAHSNDLFHWNLWDCHWEICLCFVQQEEEPEFVAEDEVDVSDLSDIEVKKAKKCFFSYSVVMFSLLVIREINLHLASTLGAFWWHMYL